MKIVGMNLIPSLTKMTKKNEGISMTKKISKRVSDVLAKQVSNDNTWFEKLKKNNPNVYKELISIVKAYHAGESGIKNNRSAISRVIKESFPEITVRAREIAQFIGEFKND